MGKLSLALLVSFIVCYTECAYYNMIFHDDFDTSSLNTSKWSTVTQNMPTRSELTYYTYENVFMNYNYLFLRAQRRPYGGSQWGSQSQPVSSQTPQQPQQSPFVNQQQQQQQRDQTSYNSQYSTYTNVNSNNGFTGFTGQRYPSGFFNTYNSVRDGMTYTSGKVSSKGRFEFTYGVVEVRAKFPRGRGFLSVIQLVDVMNFAPVMSFMAPSTQYGQNKIMASYILDNNNMMRGVGDNDFNSYGTNFNNNNNYYYNSNNYTKEFTQMYAPDLTDDFHMYKFVWDPNYIVWYLDEREILRVSEPERIPNTKMAIEMYLSVGNKEYMYEEPDWSTSFPSYMVVDYVSVQQFS